MDGGLLKQILGRNNFTHPIFLLAPRMLWALAMVAAIATVLPASAQDWIKTGTGLGVEKIRIAVPEFKASSQDPRNTELLKTFNDTLWNDLDNAGIFEMVSKSFYPLGQIGAPADPCNFRSGLAVPHRRNIRSLRVGDPMQVSA